MASCADEGCYKSQRNQILGANQYHSREYQSELYRLITESPDVDYYFEIKEEIMGQNFLVVNAYGDAFCGKLCLIIPEEDLPSLPWPSSPDASGSQLIGLKFRPSPSRDGGALVYDGVSYVVE